MKLNNEILKNKTVKQKKEYLEKYRNIIMNQLNEINNSIADLEVEIQNINVEELVKKRIKAIDEKNKVSIKTGQISKDEYEDIMYELELYPDIIHSIQSHFDINSIADLQKSDLNYVKNKIRTIKKQHENRD